MELLYQLSYNGILIKYKELLVGREGFAPPKAQGQHVYSVPGLTTSVPTRGSHFTIFPGIYQWRELFL
jgi:hypothetical protein